MAQNRVEPEPKTETWNRTCLIETESHFPAVQEERGPRKSNSVNTRLASSPPGNLFPQVPTLTSPSAFERRRRLIQNNNNNDVEGKSCKEAESTSHQQSQAKMTFARPWVDHNEEDKMADRTNNKSHSAFAAPEKQPKG